jgi:hypothetical protein
MPTIAASADVVFLLEGIVVDDTLQTYL